MRYELKKIFLKRTNQLVLIMIVILIGYTCGTALKKVEWIDDQGNSITGHRAAVNLRNASLEWSGTLDQQLLEKALVELKHIYDSTIIDTHSWESNWIHKNKLQGLQEIADLLSWSFIDEYDTFEEMIAYLQAEDLTRFYENRIVSRNAYLYEDETSWGYYNYSPQEKEYILNQYKSLITPLDVAFHEGWVQANAHISTLLKYAIILLSFILAGIFADEFTFKTVSVYYNTFHGRTAATIVKMIIGFLIITVVYWLSVGAYSCIVLGNLGTDGANHYIQSHAGYWNVKESITFREKYVITLISGYVGFLFVGFLVIWVSGLTKSSVLAVLLPSLVILLPQYLWNFYSPVMRRIIGILPDKLFDIESALTFLYLYNINGRIVTCIPIILVIYICLTFILLFLCYRVFRNMQIT